MLVYGYVFHLLFSFALAAVSSTDYANGKSKHYNLLGYQCQYVILLTMELANILQSLSFHGKIKLRFSYVLTKTLVNIVKVSVFKN